MRKIFVAANETSFKLGQSGNPSGRPKAQAEQLEGIAG